MLFQLDPSEAAAAPVVDAAAAPFSASPLPPPAAPTVQVAHAPDYTELVHQLNKLGFPDDHSTAALRAAKGNPDVAIQFLMAEFPDVVQVKLLASSM